MTYTAQCSVCGCEHDFETEPAMQQRWRQWQDRITAGGISDEDRFLLNYALRTLRKDLLRKSAATIRRADRWSEADERANPGFRRFLIDSIAEDHKRVEEILDLQQRLATRTAKSRRKGEHANT